MPPTVFHHNNPPQEWWGGGRHVVSGYARWGAGEQIVALHPSMLLPGNFFFPVSSIHQPWVTAEHPSEQRGRGRRRAGKSGGMSGGSELTGTQTQSNITACEEKKTSKPEHGRKERYSRDYNQPLTRFSHSHQSRFLTLVQLFITARVELDLGSSISFTAMIQWFQTFMFQQEVANSPQHYLCSVTSNKIILV